MKKDKELITFPVQFFLVVLKFPKKYCKKYIMSKHAILKLFQTSSLKFTFCNPKIHS